LATGLIGGAIIGFTGLLMGGDNGVSFLMLGLSLPGLLLQDAWRFAFFAKRCGHQAFINDLVWGASMLAGFLLLSVGDSSSVPRFVLIWGGGATLAAIAGILQSGVVPSPHRAHEWWKRQRDLSPRFMAEFLATTGTSHLALFGITFVASVSVAGSLRASQILMGPVNIVFMGASLMAVPEAARFLKRSTSLMLIWCIGLTVAIAVAALSLGAIVLSIPSSWGLSMLGQAWKPGKELIIPMATAYAVGGAIIGAGTGLRALAASRVSLRLRMFTAPVTLVCTIGGALLGGAMMSAWGLALAHCIGAAAWWRGLTRTCRRFESERHRASPRPP